MHLGLLLRRPDLPALFSLQLKEEIIFAVRMGMNSRYPLDPDDLPALGEVEAYQVGGA
jgi:hypothetical protein